MATVYRSFEDLATAHYFAFPPQGEHYQEMAPDGTMMTIIACRIGSQPRHEPEVSERHLYRRHRNQRDTPEGRHALIDNELKFRDYHRAVPDLEAARRNAVPKPERPKPARTFRPNDVATRPHEYFTDVDVAEIKERAAHVIIDLCAICSFLPHDKQLQPKLADRLRELMEREIESSTNYGLRLAAELEALNRASLHSEIDFNNSAAKERQLHYLRSQMFLLKRINEGILEGYETVMGHYAEQHGRWHGYKPIGYRGRKWRKPATKDLLRIGEKHRHTMLDELGPLGFARWIKKLKETSGLGVDAPEPGTTTRMRHGRDAKPGWNAPDGADEADLGGSDEWTQPYARDSVRRRVETDGQRDYGAYDTDWGYDDEE